MKNSCNTMRYVFGMLVFMDCQPNLRTQLIVTHAREKLDRGYIGLH